MIRALALSVALTCLASGALGELAATDRDAIQKGELPDLHGENALANKNPLWSLSASVFARVTRPTSPTQSPRSRLMRCSTRTCKAAKFQTKRP
jgi:hypothetical protein